MAEKVKFPCEHGRWFRHPVDTKPPKWVWCEGGETKWLREFELGNVPLSLSDSVFVEVSDE